MKNLKRDASKIHSVLEVKGDIIKCNRDLKIVIPARFKEKKLAVVTNNVSIVGIFAFILDDKFYGVSCVNAMMSLNPTNTNTTYFDGEEYIEFFFEKDSIVIKNKNLVAQGSLPYLIFDEIVDKGKTPWYLEENDIDSLFDTASKYAGFNPRTDHAIFEMLTAFRFRQAKDKSKFLRHQENPSDYEVIPLNSVQYGATNTSSKLIGAYLDEGLSSALVNPAERSERIEELLRE